MEIKNTILAMSNNLTNAANDYIHRILTDFAVKDPGPTMPSSKQGNRPALFKSQHSGAFLAAALNSSTKVNSALGNNSVTRQNDRSAYVKIDRNIGEKRKSSQAGRATK